MPGMYLDEPKAKSRTKTWIRIVYLFLIVLIIIAFRTEIGVVLQFSWGLIKLFMGEALAIHQRTLSSILILIFNLFIFIIALVIMANIVSAQALLPVSTSIEKRRTVWHLILHILHKHGPAIFVENGKVIESEEDKINKGPGVTVIDYNSAVVLEEQIPAANTSIPKLNPYQKLRFNLGIFQPYNSPRAHGAGVTFTRPRERIRGVVDLRKQSRSRADVHGYTRDGIKVSTLVWTLFTIGQDPDVLQVTYDGERIAENLRVLNLKQIPHGKKDFTVKIIGLNNELDEDDKEDIHKHALDVLTHQAMSIYTDLPRPGLVPVFNEERVFNAVFSEARGAENELMPWVQLPPHVAVDIFRELLSKYNYDQLYQPEEQPDFPIPALRGQFRTQVRNTGLLSYRLIFHKTRKPFTPGEYNPNDLRISPVFDLQGQKVLRERGIKVIACGFTDLEPSDDVYQQRLDSWRARWEKETKITQATYELEAMRIQNKARLQAQQEVTYDLMKILSSTNHSQEALALRVFQALETLAADPKTKQLLPRDTIDLMTNLDYLLTQ
jgi:hypothetical protein